MTEISVSVGKKIREARRNQCISITEAAHYLGVLPPQMSRYERGVNPVCTDTLYRLSLLFECSITEFFSDFTCNSDPDNSPRYDTATMIEDYFSQR